MACTSKRKGKEMVPRGPKDQKDTCLTHTPDGHGVRREIRVHLQPSFGSEERRGSIKCFSDDRSHISEAPLGGLEVVWDAWASVSNWFKKGYKI